jgi:lipoprotein-anchoring transpeptidase ErfK/SrfK
MPSKLNRRGILSAVLLLGATHLAPAAVASSDRDDHANGRRVVRTPSSLAVGEIIVSLADRRLYHVHAPGRAISYPIATPRDRDLWEGTQIVTAKRASPSWVPTPTMLRENPRLPRFVPGGHPFNPMGARALHLGHTYYRIHGTDAPWLIGQNVSKGCIRMLDPHVIELFDAVSVGNRVTVTRSSIASASHVARSRGRDAAGGGT